MKHLGTVRLETDRLILRRFALDDAGAMYRNWASSDRVTRFLTWPTHKSVDVSRKVLGVWMADYEKDDCYQWAIELKSIGEPIGSIAVVEHNDKALSAQIGYCIGESWWRQGITTEAMTCVMEFLMGQVGVRRVEARHDVNNPHSGDVMRKCGMVCEGTLRQADWNNQGICDIRIYARLAEEKT